MKKEEWTWQMSSRASDLWNSLLCCLLSGSFLFFGKKFAIWVSKRKLISYTLDIVLTAFWLISHQNFPAHARQLFPFMYSRSNILYDLHLIVILLIV